MTQEFFDLFTEIVPQLSLVLVASGIALNLVKDLLDTEIDSSGLVPVTMFAYTSSAATTARSLVPPLTRFLVLANSLIVFEIVASALGFHLAMTINDDWRIDLTSDQTVRGVTMLADLTMIMFTSLLIHFTMQGRIRGATY